VTRLPGNIIIKSKFFTIKQCKNKSPKAVLAAHCPELLETVSAGYTSRFIPLHNGSLFCVQDGSYYDIDDLDFFEVSVETANVNLFHVKATDGTQGFILQKRNK